MHTKHLKESFAQNKHSIYVICYYYGKKNFTQKIACNENYVFLLPQTPCPSLEANHYKKALVMFPEIVHTFPIKYIPLFYANKNSLCTLFCMLLFVLKIFLGREFTTGLRPHRLPGLQLHVT